MYRPRRQFSETRAVEARVSKILRTAGPKAARRFLNARGGPARHLGAAGMIARAAREMEARLASRAS